MKKELELPLHEKLREKMLLLPDFAVDFLYSIENSKEIRTRIEYAKDIILFLEFLIEAHKCNAAAPRDLTPTDLDQLKERDINDFFDYLTSYKRTYLSTTGKEVVQEFTNSAQGKSRKLATLHKLFAYLFTQKKMISKDITQGHEIKVPAKVKINNRLSPDEIQRLFSTIMDDLQIENQRRLKFHEKVKYRDYMIVLFLSYTGIRISELVQLDIDDIHTQKQKFVVTRKGGDQQAITMPERILEDISDFISHRKNMNDIPSKETALFLSLHKKRIDPKTVRLMLEKYRQRAGIETKITPHVFRRTFGTKHYNTYQDMYLTAQILGHNSAETTRKFYADPSEDRVARSMQEFDYDQTSSQVDFEDKISKLAKKLGISANELLEELK